MSAKGLLLINLGSPEAPTPRAVGRYLREFLTDPYVIGLPRLLRYILVYGLIAPLRKKKSAAAYKKIWTPAGSPLVELTGGFARKVQERLGEGWEVRWAMRYGEPSIAQALSDWPIGELRIVPLYPQYAESSTLSALAVCRRFVGTRKNVFYLQDFFAEPEFIESQALQIDRCLETGPVDQLILSFHGLPEHHLTQLHGSHCQFNASCCARVTENNRLCYRAQCHSTTSALSARLARAKGKIKISFQSRLGRRPWIMPYTDHLVSELALAGSKRLLLSCPSFVADCLETLEEVQIRLREQFLAEGGEELRLVPALNAEDHWVQNFCKMLQRDSLSWNKFIDSGN